MDALSRARNLLMNDSSSSGLANVDGSFHARLAGVGLELPDVVRPSRHFEPAVRRGQWVGTSGQVPLRADGLVAQGVVGADVDLETAQRCAMQCVLNALAAVNDVVALESIEATSSLTVYVASANDFYCQPAVADAASMLLTYLLGTAGQHMRSAVGVVALPRNAPVEIELTALCAPAPENTDVSDADEG